MSRYSIRLNFFVCVTLLIGCSSTPRPKTGNKKTNFSAKTLAKSSLRTFLDYGHHKIRVIRDFKIRLDPYEVLNSDVYFSKHENRAPLAIIQHGNLANKTFHARQAEKLASWGIHALVVEQPNKNRWVKNGHTLARLAKLLYKWPQLLANRFNKSQIVLIGHSFGGSAVSIAAGKGAPVSGIILLDPALVSKKVKPYLKRIKVPTVILGADKKVFTSRRRNTFFRMIPENVMEISVAKSTHNDAQYPHMFKWKQWFGMAQSPKPKFQERFTAAMTTAVISITNGSDTGVAWKMLTAQNSKGFIEPRRK